MLSPSCYLEHHALVDNWCIKLKNCSSVFFIISFINIIILLKYSWFMISCIILCFFCLFIYLFLVVLSLHSYERAFSGCGYSGLLSHCGTWTSYCDRFSCCRAEAPVGFSDCSTWAQYLWLKGPRAFRLQSLWQAGLVAPRHVRYSWTRDWTHVPCIGR